MPDDTFSVSTIEMAYLSRRSAFKIYHSFINSRLLLYRRHRYWIIFVKFRLRLMTIHPFTYLTIPGVVSYKNSDQKKSDRGYYSYSDYYQNTHQINDLKQNRPPEIRRPVNFITVINYKPNLYATRAPI